MIEATRTEPFWMIYGLDQSPPRATHETFDQAKREAERLARNNPGIAFFVLQSIACAVKQDIEFRRMQFDELPF